MADFDAIDLINIEVVFGTVDPIPAMELAGSGSGPAPVLDIYLMRGWVPGVSDYEYWQAVGAPNTTNPSGLPIDDVTIRIKWST